MLLNTAKLKPGCLSADGRLFHIFGPECEKLLSQNRVSVRGNNTGSGVSRAKMMVGKKLDGRCCQGTAALGRQVTGT